MNNVVLSGATGAIGMALIKKCIETETEVTVLIRKESSRVSRIPDHPLVSIMYCGLSEMSGLADSKDLPGADVFYHLAWEGTSGKARNDVYMQNKNVEYALDAVRLAKAFGCTAFIGAGSQAECGRVEGLISPDTPCFPENGYGMAKLCAGQMTRTLSDQLGIRHVWTRILSVYGPYDNENSMIISAIRRYLKGEVPEFTKGEQMWDYLYSDDAAETLYQLGVNACKSDKNLLNRPYVIGSGTAEPLKEYIKMMRDAIDSSLDMGLGRREYAPGQVMHLQADISSLEKDVDFKPTVSFDEGIRRTIEWCRKTHLS